MSDLSKRILEVEADDDTGSLARALEAVLAIKKEEIYGTGWARSDQHLEIGWNNALEAVHDAINDFLGDDHEG